jgi:hypothetical protein
MEDGFEGMSAGFLFGSKLIIRIFGIQASFESNPTAFAERFLVREGVVDEGDDDDMSESSHVVVRRKGTKPAGEDAQSVLKGRCVAMQTVGPTQRSVQVERG